VPFDVDARVLRCERRPAPPEIGRIFGLELEEAVYEVERVRFVQRRPVSLQVSHLPARLCPDLESRDLAGAHLYDVLQCEYGTIFLRAEEYVEPVLADDYVADQLQVPRGSPLFLVERHSTPSTTGSASSSAPTCVATCTATGSTSARPDAPR
jgi:GntR family transcriptional regulator